MKTTNYKKADKLNILMSCVKGTAPYKVDFNTGSVYKYHIWHKSYVYSFDFNTDTEKLNKALNSFTNKIKGYERIYKALVNPFYKGNIYPQLNKMLHLLLDSTYKRISNDYEVRNIGYSNGVWRVEFDIDNVFMIDIDNETLTVIPEIYKIKD